LTNQNGSPSLPASTFQLPMRQNYISGIKTAYLGSLTEDT